MEVLQALPQVDARLGAPRLPILPRTAARGPVPHVLPIPSLVSCDPAGAAANGGQEPAEDRGVPSAGVEALDVLQKAGERVIEKVGSIARQASRSASGVLGEPLIQQAIQAVACPSIAGAPGDDGRGQRPLV